MVMELTQHRPTLVQILVEVGYTQDKSYHRLWQGLDAGKAKPTPGGGHKRPSTKTNVPKVVLGLKLDLRGHGALRFLVLRILLLHTIYM